MRLGRWLNMRHIETLIFVTILGISIGLGTYTMYQISTTNFKAIIEGR